MYPFKDVIQSEEEFREIMGSPGPRVLAKSTYHIDPHSKAFIEKSPFLLLSSIGEDGQATVSPKGDPNGFVQVLDDHTLIIPERPGNKRAETFQNILHNPNVGLIFMVPGKGETLRISGQARIVSDESLRKRFVINGKVPLFVIGIDVGEIYFHCAKAITRSKLWKTESWPDVSGLASLGQIMVDNGKLTDSKESMEEIVANDARDRLY